MAELKATKAPEVAGRKLTTVDELLASDRSTWEYVTIPKENALGETHATISNNKLQFKAGETYFIPKPIADDVRERLHVYARSCVRTLQPRRDFSAENDAMHGGSARSGGAPVDASLIQTLP